MWTHMILGALAVGPFSGVDLSNLTATPMLVRETVFEAAGEQLLAVGEGMTLEERDGQQVAVTGEGFFIEFEAELPPGKYGLAATASAPGRGSDSYWLEVDGEQLERPIVPPVGAMDERSIAANVTEAGKHTFRLILREAPGSVLQRIELYAAKTKTPMPPMREDLIGKHPRIFFTAQDLEAMRARLNDERVQRFYQPTGVLTREPAAFEPGKRNGGRYRSLGNYALSYLLEPSEEKLEGIIPWLEMATTYPHCGVDLDAEYYMEGLALTYDWLYEDIPDDLRVGVREAIARQARQVYDASLHGRTGGGLSFQQNHYWFAHLSLALGAAAICGEVPEAEQWLAWAWDRFERIALSFSPDGGFHEGPAYWNFSMPTLYMYTGLYEWCTGLRIPAGDEGLTGQAEFIFHHLYPGLARSAALEDTTTRIGRPPVRLLLWEARRFEDSLPQGMAELLSGGPSSSAFNFLWLDEKVQGADPLEALPLARYYPDIETAFARTSWEDDATHVAFVSRPLGGHKWAELCDKLGLGGTGHNHPEQNHFILFGRGEVLAADPGYTYEKMTRNHNTVLVDGQGQYGDGEMWPRPKPGRAHITQFVTDADVTIVTGDATSAYPEELGLTRFERTVVLAGRDLVVVYDRLATEEPRTFSWLLHHYGELGQAEKGWTITRNGAQVAVLPFLPHECEAEASTYRPEYIHSTRDLTPKEDPDINLLEMNAGPATEMTFLVPLLIGGAGEELPESWDVSAETCDALRIGDTVVAFNCGDGTMIVPMPWEEKMETEAAVLVARVHDGERQVVRAPAD